MALMVGGSVSVIEVMRPGKMGRVWSGRPSVCGMRGAASPKGIFSGTTTTLLLLSSDEEDDEEENHRGRGATRGRRRAERIANNEAVIILMGG